jgi:hypothetical protein
MNIEEEEAFLYYVVIAKFSGLGLFPASQVA